MTVVLLFPDPDLTADPLSPAFTEFEIITPEMSEGNETMIDNPALTPDLEDLAGEMCFIEKRAQVCERLIESYRQDKLRGFGPTREDIDGLVVLMSDMSERLQKVAEHVEGYAGSR